MSADRAARFELSAGASYLHASHWSRRRPAWKKSWFVSAPPIPSCFPSLAALISARHLVLLCLCATPLTTHYQCYKQPTNHDYVLHSQPLTPHTTLLSNINLGCRTPTRHISRQSQTPPQSWTLHAHRIVAIPSRRCHTVTTPYPAAPRAIPTTQFPPILPFHMKSAKCRHGFSQGLLSQIRLDQALKALVPRPTRPATPTHPQHQ